MKSLAFLYRQAGVAGMFAVCLPSHPVYPSKGVKSPSDQDPSVGFSISRTEELMLKRLFVIAVAAVLATGMSYADESKSKVTIPVIRTAPSDGKLMYSSYCAPCHGVDARGQGPVASAL